MESGSCPTWRQNAQSKNRYAGQNNKKCEGLQKYRARQEAQGVVKMNLTEV